MIVIAVKGCSLPFFRENSYAMCIFNHLMLDKNCVWLNSENSKESFSASLCRLNDFHSAYPQLTT